MFPEAIEGELARYERWSARRHTEALVTLCRDAEVMRFLGGASSPAIAEDLSARLEDHWDTFGYGLWAVVDREQGRIAGFAGVARALWHPEYLERTEVGWRLARWSWGRGFATEGGRLGLKSAFEHLGLDEVVAFVHPDNERSLSVTDRLGMTAAGRTTDPRLHHDLVVLNARR